MEIEPLCTARVIVNLPRFRGHLVEDAGERRAGRRRLRRTPDPRTAFNHAALGDAKRWAGRVHEITAPALVIHGTEDPVLPYAHGLALHDALPNATLLTLEGASHELHPADWGVILDAIERHTGRAGLTHSRMK
ncbi:MAG TPA: alpha/beta hydrolase [Woeseiaceae bacterium]